MNRRVKFDISDLERIGSIECLYDSERISKEELELVRNSNADTLSRANLDSLADPFDTSGIIAGMQNSVGNPIRRGTNKSLRMIPSDEAY